MEYPKWIEHAARPEFRIVETDEGTIRVMAPDGSFEVTRAVAEDLGVELLHAVGRGCEDVED